MKNILAIISIIIMLASCKTLHDSQVVYVHQTDTMYLSSYKLDSVIIADTLYINGDTVREIHWRIKNVVKTDTIYKSTNDSLYQQETITKEVVKNSKFAQGCIWFSIIITIFIIIYILLRLFTKMHI